MFNLPFIKKKKVETQILSDGLKPVVLLVLDGWGIAPPSEGNAISRAKTPNMDRFYSHYPHGELIAAGESVGLPANEEGNSEVGHLMMGAGRVILQSLKRINLAIEDGSFYDNKAFYQVTNHVHQYQAKLHLMGLVGSGSVHSSNDHLFALLEYCRRNGLENVYLHLFTDGRDAPPQEGGSIIAEIEEELKEMRLGKIASVSGRYYAMDRDLRWQRTQKAYEAVVKGQGVMVNSASEAIRRAYSKGQTDEFIEPTVIVKKKVGGDLSSGENGMEPVGIVSDNDAVIFFNFRVDRPRQLTMAFVLDDFENLKSYTVGDDPHHEKKEGAVFSGHTFDRGRRPSNLFFVTMTEYKKGLPVSMVAFPPSKVANSLSNVLAEKGLKQLHLAESEKERMVTIYFDGLHDGRFKGEEVIIIPSPKVGTYDKKPEMSVHEIVKEFEKQVALNEYHFFVVNFANPDMVAHSGNIDATIKAIEHVDKAIGQLTEIVLRVGGTLFITADHGNAEELLSFPTTAYFFTTSQGDTNTDHSNNPVPFIVINQAFSDQPIKLAQGTLSDVAPTVLTFMGLAVPAVMTGKDLLTFRALSQNKQ